jgi:hypothetical protein
MPAGLAAVLATAAIRVRCADRAPARPNFVVAGIELVAGVAGVVYEGQFSGEGLPQTTAFKLLSCPAPPGGHPSLGWTVQTNVGDQRSAQKQSLLMLFPLVERRGRRITWSFLHSFPACDHPASLCISFLCSTIGEYHDNIGSPWP